MNIRTEVAVNLARIGLTARDIERLVLISRRLHRLHERRCNGEGWHGPRQWGDEDEATYERKASSLMARAFQIMGRRTRFVLYEQTDPRGVALYVVDRKALEGRTADTCYNSAGFPVY